MSARPTATRYASAAQRTVTMAQYPSVPEGARAIVFLNPNDGFYIIDLVQNDPFLRETVVTMVGQGHERDTRFVRLAFANASQSWRHGESSVWLLD